MNNDLKILVTGALNGTSSVTEINKGIEQIQGKIDKLNLSFKIDNSVLKTLTDFSTQMEKIADVAKNTGKIIQESINPDGSKTKTTYYNGLKGEFSQLETAAKQSGEAQLKSLNDVSSGFAKTTSDAQKYNSELQKIAQTVKLTNEAGNQSRTVNLNGQGGVTGYKDTTNYAKEEKDAQDYINFWQKALSTLENEQGKLKQSLNKLYDSGNLNEQFFKNFNTAINSAHNVEEVNKLEASLQRVSQFSKNQNLQQSLLSQSNSLLGSGKNIDSAGLTSLITNLNSLNLSETNATRQLSLMQTQLKEFQASATSAAVGARTFGDAFRTSFSNLSMYFGGTALLMASFSSLKSGIDTINQLNKSLTTIGMILHENQDQVAQLGDQYQKLGSQLSVSTTEIAKSATELIRQGLSMDDVNSKLKTITMFSKVAGLSSEDATNMIIAATNSMQVSAQKAADTFAMLGHSSGVNAGYIATAFQKVGGTAGSINLDFQKTASWIATIGERTKESADTIGQSVKSIIARVQSLREKGFDETDGTKVNQVSKALATIGVQLVDSQGQFRNFGTVMDEIGAKWSTLDNRHKAYIATTVAGTYQQSRFLDLMQGYSRSVDLYNTALNSSGAVQQKFNAWQQGTEAQIENLKNSFQGFWMSAFNSSEVQVFVASLNGIVSGLKTVSSSVGFLPAAFSVAGVAIIAFNGGLKSIMTNGMLTISVLKGIPSGLMTLESALAVTTLKTNALNFASKALTMTMNGLKAAGTFLAGAILPMLAFAAVGIAIEKITQAISNYKQKQAEIKQQQDDLVQSYSLHSDQIKQLASDYDKLSSKVAEGKLSDSSQEYIDNMNKLGQLMPSLVSSEDEHGNKILRSRDAVKEELDYAQKLKDVNDKMNVDTFSNKLDAQKNKMQDLLDQIAKLDRNSSGQDAPMLMKSKGIVQVSQETKDSNEMQKITLQHQLNSMAKESSDIIKEQVNAMMDQDKITDKLSSSQKKLVQSYIDQATATAKGIDTPEKLAQFMKDESSQAIDLAKNLAPLPNIITDVIDATNLTGDQKSVLKSISTEVKNGYTDWESYREVLIKVGFPLTTVDTLINKLKDSTNKATVSQNQYTQAVQDTYDAEMKKATSSEAMLGTTKKLIDDSKDLIGTYRLLSGQESLSADQKDLLAEATGKLTAMFPQFVNGSELNIEAMDKETKANDVLLQAVNDYKDGKLNAEQTMTLNASLGAKQRIEVMSAELSAMQTLMDTYNKAAQHQEDMAISTGDDRAYIQAQKFHNSAQQTANDYAKTKAQIDALIPSYNNQIDSLGNLIGYNNGSSSSTQNSIYVTDKYKNSIQALDAAIQNLQNLQKNYATDSQQYRDALSKEIDLLNQKKALMDAQAKSLSQQIASGNVAQTGMINTSSGGSSSSSSMASPSQVSGAYADQINAAGARYGIDPALIKAVATQESGLGSASSNVMQVNGMYGKGANASIDAGASMLADLLKQTGGNLEQALAAYNMGSGILSYFNAHGGYSQANMQGFSDMQKQKHGYSIYGDPNYVQHVERYYTPSTSTSSASGGTTTSKTAADKAQAIDQAKSALIQLQLDANSVGDQVQQLKVAIVQSKIDQVTNGATEQLNGYDNAIKNSQSVMSRYAANTAVWNAETKKQISLTSGKVSILGDEEAALKRILQTEQLTYDQRQKIGDQLLVLDQNTYTTMNDLSGLFQKMRDAQTTDKVNAITKAYNDQIAALQAQATQLDKINNQLQRNQQLQDIQNQIDKAKSDTSHEYIDSSGKVTYTYDKTAVAGLEKQKSDLQAQWKQQDQKDALNQKITDLGTQRDNVIAQIQQLNQYYATKGFQDRKDLQNIMNQFVRDLSKVLIPTDPTSATGITTFVNTILRSLGITIPKHHDGGIVSGSDNKHANLINSLFNLKPNEAVVKALKGEVMVPQSNIPNFLQNMKTMVHSFGDKTANMVQPIVKNYNFNNLTIKSDNLEGLLAEIDTITRSQ